MAALLDQVKDYIGEDTSTWDAMLTRMTDEASALVDHYIGTAQVPAGIVDQAKVAVAADLWNRRAAPNGVVNAQFSGFDGGEAVRIARDPMRPAYPILRPVGDAVVMDLTGEREAVAAALDAGGIAAATYLSERAVPPLAVVAPADPYVDRPVGEVPFAYGQVRLSVFIIGSKGTAETATRQIDNLTATALDVLWGDVTEVSAPAQIDVNGYTYLGVVITVEKAVKVT